ncbi:DNA polymerase III subunit [Psychrobacter phenylpyruvicus]|uniref:DNA-directed DNA polymerase n=1 Tax=Psychrobacter phenylpyruvicus TaxID=29432 RepID=A0A379LMD1_9GAMM|nr:DNA polymerase III subunit [Psychrobacter phenylpyruvicus]SUD90934.1 DNA polymerase III subunit delta' [Psychrobacter phenylpyruvicus]
MKQQLNSDESVYFAPLLPWQQSAWDHLLSRYERLPHGLLFAGMQGIGKRAFVWRFVAWLLCDNRMQTVDSPNQQGACGHCQSCQWLQSGTHPDLQVLPLSSLPVSQDSEVKEPTKKSKGTSKSSQKKNSSVASEPAKTSIKVDDIRELQPFISQGSSGRRVCVIDNADMMTVAAANALLKTLEEPRDGIHLLLVTDWPTKLLPTIKSRVQQVAIDHIQLDKVTAYISDYIKSNKVIDYETESQLATQVEQALKLSNGAPLAAIDMLGSEWYKFRDTWIKVWLALRVGKRSSIAASDYWQQNLAIDDFIKLSEFMLMDFSRQSLGLKPLQTDLELAEYASINSLSLDSIQQLMSLIEDIKLSSYQNVQPKMAYDRLLSGIAAL